MTQRLTGVSSSARQSTVRTANLGLVLRTVCAAAGPLSRADIAGLTGVTRATAARLADELVAGGLLDEVEREALHRRGRPATPLVPGARFTALGLQADAGLLAARVVDLRGRVVAERVEHGDHRDSDPTATLAALGALATDVLTGLPADHHLVGAGLALPGVVDAEAGVLLRAPNLGWSDLRAVDLLAPFLPADLDLGLGNEADLAARTVAEEAPGRPGHHRDVVYLSGQIGIGGAVVLGGRVTGSSGWAGEVGHVCVDPAGPACSCGSTGCLELYAGRHALLRAAGLPLDTPPGDLARLAAAGTPAAVAALDTGAWALGVALAGVVDAEAGVLLRAPNLGWSDLRAADLLAPFLPADLDLVLGNEADLAARTVAEEAPGRPGHHRDVVYLSGQIGIGGAVVLGGRVTGSSGWAGEVGHVCVDPAGPACSCGSTGCLELYAGRHALLRAAGLPLDTPPGDLARLAAAGAPAAVAALDTGAWALGVALAGVVNVVGIPTVVLGGHLAELADLLRPALEQHLTDRVLSARWRRPRVVGVPGPPAAGASGAALQVLADVLADPARQLG